MAHELTIRADGKVEMAFRAGTDFPWHFAETQPQQVAANASIEEWVQAAGMEWTVEPSPVQFEANGTLHTFDDRYVLHRSDTIAPLGVVSGDYCILQPAEVIEFFADLVQTVGLTLDTAGTLFGGRRFWALAKIGESCIIDNRDRIKAYLLLTSSADGLRATEARFTSVRVVCNNTLSLSDSKDSAGQIKIAHRSEWDADEVKRRLGVAPVTFEAFMTNMRKLADHRLTDDRAREQVKKVLGEEAAEKDSKTFVRVMDLFRGLATGADAPGFAGTAWGLLNGLTEVVDHGGRAKSDSHRLANALMGTGDRLKTRFRDQLLELVA
jgi:phage/plasmid-like protein (TIGR03299 family)